MPGESFENPTPQNNEENPLEKVEDVEETMPEENQEETEEEKETKKFQKNLENLIGPERLEEIKEKAAENEGVSVNSELLVSEFDNKDFIGKTVEEARALVKEKLPDLPEEKRKNWESYLQEPDEKIKELLKRNEAEFIEFEKAREESLRWFIESDIKNIRLNNWHPESWLRWDNVEKGKSGEFEIDPRAEEIIDRLVKAGKKIDLVLAFGNKDYFGKENQYNIPSSEEEREAWKNFCGFMAEHFKGKINRFEIGSEPNAKPKGLGEKFTEGFPPNSNPELYGEVFGETAEIIKNKNPEAETIFGNVALFDPEFVGKGLEKTQEYEEKSRKDGKIKPDQHLVDYVGFHPYRKNPEAPSGAVENGVGRLSKEQDEAARKKYGYKSYDDQIEIYEKIVGKHYPNAKLINTEVGWHTEAPDEHSWVPDEKTQAEYTLKAAAIDASHGISTNIFELFEKAIGEKNSLMSKEGKPREGLKNLESFNKYLESLKKQGGGKETPEEWVETHKEHFKEKASLIFRELYKKVFPEKTFNIDFLDLEAFSKCHQDKELSLPPGKIPEELVFNRFEEEDAMNYIINEKLILEWLKERVEFAKEKNEQRTNYGIEEKLIIGLSEFTRERKGQRTNDEIAEKLIIGLSAHEIRHDLHREKSIESITSESLSGYEESQKEYEEILKCLLQVKGYYPRQIPEECDCKIVDETAENLWERGIKDIDLISKIVRNGDGSNIGEISNLLKNEELTTPQLLEKIKEVMRGDKINSKNEEMEETEKEIKEISFAELERGDKLSVETLLGKTINKFEIFITGKRKDGLRVIVRSEYGKETEEFTARMPGGITMHRDGLTGYLKVEDGKEKNCLFFKNIKDVKTKERIISSIRTTPIQKIVLKKGKE